VRKDARSGNAVLETLRFAGVTSRLLASADLAKIDAMTAPLDFYVIKVTLADTVDDDRRQHPIPAEMRCTRADQLVGFDRQLDCPSYGRSGASSGRVGRKQFRRERSF
jgi:hypothetical protein